MNSKGEGRIDAMYKTLGSSKLLIIVIPISTWSPPFSRALGCLIVFTLSSRWLLKVFSFHLKGRCYSFGFGFKTLDRKALY